jgi:hypothetical protein
MSLRGEGAQWDTTGRTWVCYNGRKEASCVEGLDILQPVQLAELCWLVRAN